MLFENVPHVLNVAFRVDLRESNKVIKQRAVNPRAQNVSMEAKDQCGVRSQLQCFKTSELRDILNHCVVPYGSAVCETKFRGASIFGWDNQNVTSAERVRARINLGLIRAPPQEERSTV